MIVVAIVGILSMMAVVGYRKLVNSSHSAEASHMVNAIRVGQEAFHAETGAYANISTVLSANGQNLGVLYPHGSATPPRNPGNFKVGWGAACSTGCRAGMDWTMLPVHADGSTMFGYTTIAGQAGVAVPNTATVTINGTAITWPASTPADWFLITAVGDTDGNGTFSTFLATSFNSDVLVDKDGE